MTRAEVLVPFLVSVIVLLGYIAIVVRRLSRSVRWFRQLPREHHWLMEQTKTNSQQIKDLNEVIRTLVERS